MKRERIEYLDFIKAISIILVVFCHQVALSNDTIIGNIIMAMAWAAVPNFFFVTGGLLHQTQSLNWKKHIYRIIHTYTILCIWKIIYLIFFFFVKDISFSKVDLIKYIFLFDNIQNVESGLMWFMYAYLTVLIFFPISYYLFKNKNEGQKTLGFVLIVLFLKSFLVTAINFLFKHWSLQTGRNLLEISISKIMPFGEYSNMLFFFITGAFLLQYRDKINNYIENKPQRKLIPPLLFITGLAGLVFIKYCDTGLISWGGYYITAGYSRLSTVLMSFGLYLILQNWKMRKPEHILAKYVGTTTMGIYYIHVLLLVCFKNYFHTYYQVYGSLGLNVLKTVFAVIICAIITIFFKKIPLVKNLVK